jgi:hypothetical protein
MKNVLLLCLLLSLCPNTAPAQVREGPQTTPLPPGVIPIDVKYHNFAHDAASHNLGEFINYYRDEVLALKQESYYNNLRKACISSMVDQYKLNEIGDYRTLLYFTSELMDINLPDSEQTAKMLRSLKGILPDADILRMAREKHAADLAYIRANFDNPEALIAKKRADFEHLEHFSLE